MSDQKRYDFWESWCRIFGPPALEWPGHVAAAPEKLPTPGSEIIIHDRRGRVLEVFRTARTRALDGDRPPHGWRVRVLLEDGRIVLCKPAHETQ